MDKQTPTPDSISPLALSELLGVGFDTLRQWRTKAFADHPKYLVANGPSLPGTKAHSYLHADVIEWLNRPDNRSYMDRVLAMFTPDPVRQAFTAPQPPVPHPDEASAWWSSLGASFADQHTPDQPAL